MAETTTEKPATTASQDQTAETRPGWRESVESLLVTIILALFATCFVVQAFKIPSPSMEPTLLVGDHLLVNKFIFEGNGAWYDRFLPYRAIRHGDVIVFKFPFQDHPHYVKRVIGLPGDKVKIINSVVYVNGQALKEPYAVHDAAAYDPFAENFPPTNQDYLDAAVLPQWRQELPHYVDAAGEIVVPPGHYFVMGDNRDHSWDSRYWGFVPRDAIMGRPVVIYWSLKEPDETTDDVAPPPSSRNWMFSVIDTLLRLPVETRWDRMMREVH
ncbi:MAG: signal peptidase I [Acidobacteriota bacterium]|nr:signal peptidase I [Acidobacteriota bacterium]